MRKRTVFIITTTVILFLFVVLILISGVLLYFASRVPFEAERKTYTASKQSEFIYTSGVEPEKEDGVLPTNAIYEVKAVNPSTGVEESVYLFRSYYHVHESATKVYARFSDHGSEGEYGDYLNPKLIYKLDPQIRYESLQVYDQGDQNLYLSVVNWGPESELGTGNPNVNEVYQVSKATKAGTLVWSHRLNENENEYDDKRGAAGVAAVDGEFLALSLYPCYACGPGPAVKPGVVIVNLKTRAELYIGEVGNVKFDMPNLQVQAQQYILVNEPCEIGYMCDTGTWEVAKAEGESVVFDLP